MTNYCSFIPASKAALREVILPLLDESDEPFDDDNLIDYGLDSVRMMALARAGAKCMVISTLSCCEKPTSTPVEATSAR